MSAGALSYAAADRIALGQVLVVVHVGTIAFEVSDDFAQPLRPNAAQV